jgi:probable DNA metabolism protein
MDIVVCDGSFPGFLCAVAEAINMSRAGQAFPVIRSMQEGETLFDTVFKTGCDNERAKRLWNRIEARAGREALLTCRDAFLSDSDDRIPASAHGLARIYAEGAGALDDWSDSLIAAVAKAALRCRSQAHLIKGILRFTELSDASLYAPIQPECDVLPLVGDHFASRFSGFRFAIHDIGRNTAIINEPGSRWRYFESFSLQVFPECSLQAELPVSAEEISIRDAWFKYFQSVSIEARKNKKLQAGHLPKKYWKFLPEMQSGKAHATIALKGKDLPWISN